MAHPYALPSQHHPHRVNHPTPASSVDLLPPQPISTAASMTTSSSSSSLPIPGPRDTNPSPGAPIPSTAGPQRRRRRSIRAPSKSAARKKSEAGSAPSSSAASLSEEAARRIDEQHVPTRVYQFKSFDSFDSLAPKPGDVPAGSDYTFEFPSTSASSSSSAPPPPPHAPPIPSGHATIPRPPGMQRKKSSAILNVGKRVVKEVLGGGGNYAPAPQEGKAVYYGRGGAGGVGQKPNKPPNPASGSTSLPHPIQQAQKGSPSKPTAESHRSSSYYTGSSAYTPSIVSSPYAESIASSPYATSVDDASVYADSSNSVSHNQSLRPASRPSPSHRSLSPAGFSDSRRDSIVSSFPGTQSASDGDEAFDPSGASGSYWSSPLGGGSQRQLTPHLPEETAPGDRFTELPGPAIPHATAYRPRDPLRDEIGAGSGPLRHRPSKPSMLSYSSGAAAQLGQPIASYPAQIPTTTQYPSPYPPTSTAPIRSSDTASGSVPAGQYQASAPISSFRGPLPTTTTSSLMGALTDPRPSESRSPPGTGATPSPLPQYSTVDTTYSPWSQPTPLVNRPLPDPLAQAVGQLSLIQNPLNVGWPLPQNISQYYTPSGAQMPLVGAASQAPVPYQALPVPEQTPFPVNPDNPTPNYAQSQFMSHTPSTAYSDPCSSGEDEYLKTLAEQRALVRRIAELEQLQQQQSTGMIFQQPPYSDPGRMM